MVLNKMLAEMLTEFHLEQFSCNHAIVHRNLFHWVHPKSLTMMIYILSLRAQRNCYQKKKKHMEIPFSECAK